MQVHMHVCARLRTREVTHDLCLRLKSLEIDVERAKFIAHTGKIHTAKIMSDNSNLTEPDDRTATCLEPH